MTKTNTKTLGLLLGLGVFGIVFTGGAAAADSTDVAELDTQDCPNCHQEITSTFVALGTQDCPNCHQEIEVTPFDGCCCCPMKNGVAPFDEARIVFVAGVEA